MLLLERLVSARVWGITHTWNLFDAGPTTVREIPSRVTEPLSMRYLDSEISNSKMVELPWGVMLMIWAKPSTCP